MFNPAVLMTMVNIARTQPLQTTNQMLGRQHRPKVTTSAAVTEPSGDDVIDQLREIGRQRLANKG